MSATFRFTDDLVLQDVDDPTGIYTVGTLLAELGALRVSDDEACRRIHEWLTKNEPSDSLLVSIAGSRYGKGVFWRPIAISA